MGKKTVFIVSLVFLVYLFMTQIAIVSGVQDRVSLKKGQDIARRFLEKEQDLRLKVSKRERQIEEKIESGVNLSDASLLSDSLADIKKMLDEAHLEIIYGGTKASFILTQTEDLLDKLGRKIQESRPNAKFKSYGKFFKKLHELKTRLYLVQIVMEQEKNINSKRYETWWQEWQSIDEANKEHIAFLEEYNPAFNQDEFKSELKGVEKRIDAVEWEFYGSRETYWAGDARKYLIENRGNPIRVQNGLPVVDQNGRPLLNKTERNISISFQARGSRFLQRNHCFSQRRVLEDGTIEGEFRFDFSAQIWSYNDSPKIYIFIQGLPQDALIFNASSAGRSDRGFGLLSVQREDLLFRICNNKADPKFYLLYAGDFLADPEMVATALLQGGSFVEFKDFSTVMRVMKATGVKEDFKIGNFWVDAGQWGSAFKEFAEVEKEFRSYFNLIGSQLTALSSRNKKLESYLKQLAECLNGSDEEKLRRLLPKGPAELSTQASVLEGKTEKRFASKKLQQKLLDKIIERVSSDTPFEESEVFVLKNSNAFLFFRLDGMTIKEATTKLSCEVRIWHHFSDPEDTERKLQRVEVKLDEGDKPKVAEFESVYVATNRNQQIFAIVPLGLMTNGTGNYEIEAVFKDNLAGKKTPKFSLNYDVIP